MAYFRIDYYSRALRRRADFELMIPNDTRPEEAEQPPLSQMDTLFLLHGYTGKAENWVPEWLAKQYHFAIVMPTAENSFYLNGEATGRAYQTLVGEELPDYVRATFGLARSAGDTCIAGLSMGGFGALHTGLAYPERFGKIGALSSALIVHEVAGMRPGFNNGRGNYDYYRLCFGDPATVLDSDNNPETLVRRLKAAGKALPGICMWCGTEDFLLENNRQFHRFLLDEGIAHGYHEAPGQHDMQFWSTHIVDVVRWMFDRTCSGAD